ncbi:serine/threonine-protein kinase [Nocardia sp. NPDC056000]|uniref:serine/threonine-protein kinase n=1 Tax=Nocardia sp. NPDC056000 TaxID=3345674 RepID=UPI0035E00D1B
MAVIEFKGRSEAIWAFDDSKRIGDPSGFGKVFEGHDEVGSPVAVKRVGADVDMRRRVRELQIGDLVAQAPSAHLLSNLDYAIHGDNVLVVMPIAECSLEGHLKGERVDFAEGIEIIRQIAIGLQDLANASIVHRDLKPGNILRVDGNWKLADFGISRDLSIGTAGPSETFKGYGTKQYMAPELWRLESANHKSDLYALGVIAHQILVGGFPFIGDGDNSEWRELHLNTMPLEPPVDIPSGIRRLMVRLLHKNASSRPQNATAVIESIDRSLVPHTSNQAKLEQQAYLAEQRSAQQDVHRETANNQLRLAADRKGQAVADLDDLVATAFELAEILGDVDLAREGEHAWRLKWHTAEVRLVLFEALPKPHNPNIASAWRRSVDTGVANNLVHAGGIYSTARASYPFEEFPVANIVCKVIDGGELRWLVLRFESREKNFDLYRTYGGNERLGPLDRWHGLTNSAFIHEWPYVLSPPILNQTDIWNREEIPLTPELIMDLLSDAIAEG